MQQRDLLKDQIEQLGKVLAKILGDFLGWKSTGNPAPGIEAANERFQNELGIDIEQLITLDRMELKSYFRTHQLAEPHLEMLSEYLAAVGKLKNETKQGSGQLYLKKAIEVLDIADEVSETLSFVRMNKKREIEKLL